MAERTTHEHEKKYSFILNTLHFNCVFVLRLGFFFDVRFLIVFCHYSSIYGTNTLLYNQQYMLCITGAHICTDTSTRWVLIVVAENEKENPRYYVIWEGRTNGITHLDAKKRCGERVLCFIHVALDSTVDSLALGIMIVSLSHFDWWI